MGEEKDKRQKLEKNFCLLLLNKFLSSGEAGRNFYWWVISAKLF
jgi:hypothetical protein